MTDLPEECVGSTFAMLGALHWLVALDAYFGALLAVDPVHPPKIAKAKKGWL
ncbi:MAG TPA: hypothetical protein VGL23_10790 [Chloroflexota bacterium]